MRSPRWFYIFFLIGGAALTIRLLLESDFGTSGLLYLAVPFLIAVLAHQAIGHSAARSGVGRYLNSLRDATIIMLASSAILFEGFLCVLMFMPIYYFGWTIGFLFMLLKERREKQDSGKLGVYGVPILIALLSLEGVHDTLTVTRDAESTYTMVVDGTVNELKANMASPIAFDSKKHWFLSVFPWPVRVEAGSLTAGDVHKMHFVYNRWFVTNTHTGEVHLRIAEVGDNMVRTEIVKNTSYLATYLDIEGTEIRFTPLDEERTTVSLTVKYKRLLDPAWYFGPMQEFATQQTAKYLIQSVIARVPAQ